MDRGLRGAPLREHSLESLAELFPGATYLARAGQSSVWDNEDVVRAVAATDRGEPIIAGVVSDVCVA